MPPPASSSRRYVVGITGASGALYAQRLIQQLVRFGHETHLCVTPYGIRLLHDELGMEGPLDINLLAGLPEGADPREHRVFAHPAKDVGACLGSGSFRHQGMVIVPCSSNTLGAIAGGSGDNLLTRAAAVALKERFPLILAHRESPLSLIDIRNMETLTLAGAIIAPTNPGLYLLPKSIDDIVDFVVGRLLDLMGVEHELNVRWADHVARPRPLGGP